MGLVYSVLVALPLFAVLGRVLYTQWNHNANLSYSGYENGGITLDYVQSNSDLVAGDEYYLTNAYISVSHGDVGSRIQRIFYTNVEVINNGSSYDLSNTYAVGFYTITNSTSMGYYFYYDNEQYFNIGSSTPFTIKFNYTTNSLGSAEPFALCDTLYSQIYESDYQLDNAFEYSLSTFVDENDFGKLNFFSWFYDLFLSNTSRNNLYIHFVNWYMNYALLVSLTFVLFLVLMWFVSFVRKLLENSQNMHLGGL